MFDKMIELVKAQAAVKRVCIFLLAFAATLTVMVGDHGIFYGSGESNTPEKSRTAQESAVSSSKKASADADIKNGDAAESKTEDKGNADNNAGEEVAESKTSKAKKTATDATTSEASEEGDESGEEPEGFKYSAKIPMRRELQEYTYKKCMERGIEYELVLAIIWRESKFTENAVNVNTNGTRDNGIMQINDVNRGWLRERHGITDLMDPYQNIDAGTTMLGMLTSKYGAHNAMLAYQYGEGGMARRLKQGITTSEAIIKAYKQRDHYREII